MDIVAVSHFVAGEWDWNTRRVATKARVQDERGPFHLHGEKHVCERRFGARPKLDHTRGVRERMKPELLQRREQ